MSDAEIDKLVDDCIKTVLDKQKRRIGTMAAAGLKMSSARAAIPGLVADAKLRNFRLTTPRNLHYDQCKTALDWMEFHAAMLEATKRRAAQAGLRM